MLLAGYRGHLAIIRMADKHLLSEVHLDNDIIMDAKFLHNCTMYAVARSREITLFDDRGIEVHNINRPRPTFVDFLPHHWLLTSVCQGGQLHYLDISTGSLVAQLQTPFTSPSSLTHNPRDALVSVSSTTTGIVNLYSPNLVDKPVMSINCSNVGISRHCFSMTSPHMLVANTDGLLKIFDMRNYGSELAAFSLLNRTLTDLSISQSGVVCAASARSADFYKLSDLLAFSYDSISRLRQQNDNLLSVLERKATGTHTAAWPSSICCICHTNMTAVHSRLTTTLTPSSARLSGVAEQALPVVPMAGAAVIATPLSAVSLDHTMMIVFSA